MLARKVLHTNITSRIAQPVRIRTIRRTSHPLNSRKWNALVELVRRYAAEKDAHLLAFGSNATFARCASDRVRRDALLRNGYTSRNGLQARMWKLALKDAHETVGKKWSALAAELRPRIAQHADWSQAQRRYAYWLLQSPQRLAQLIAEKAPLPAHFEIAYTGRKTVQNYLRRLIRHKRGMSPRVKMARSAAFDANMYDVFEEGGAQYIRVMSLIPGRRIVIPLTGRTPIRGNLRLVLGKERRRIEIHFTTGVKPKPALAGEPCGLDAGMAEVFTDERGQRYGVEFGPFIAYVSDNLIDKGRKRNRLFQIAKKAAARGDTTKAHRIRKFNLGRKKQRQKARRQRAEMVRLINTAINQVKTIRQPMVVATERLDVRGKALSKKISQRVSVWVRRILKERIEFKASAEGFRREQVNPAYSSQTCPACRYVHKGNRQGEAFQCLYCGHADDADRVAAQNLKARLGDPQIALWTPKERVKAILLDRFTARLETPTGGLFRAGLQRAKARGEQNDRCNLA